jgi:hypothetical protein
MTVVCSGSCVVVCGGVWWVGWCVMGGVWVPSGLTLVYFETLREGWIGKCEIFSPPKFREKTKCAGGSIKRGSNRKRSRARRKLAVRIHSGYPNPQWIPERTLLK